MPHSLKASPKATLFESIIREGIFRMTQMGTVIYANRAFLKMFGYSSMKDFNSTTDASIFANPTDETFIKTKLIAGEPVDNQRILFQRKNNTSFWGLFSCRNDHESDAFYQGAIIDISSLVEQEQSLQLKAHALSKTNMELDRFIYSASHDIRAPISTVMGLINLIKMEKNQEKGTELVNMMETSMRKLDFFIHQLTAWSKNERQEINKTSIDVEVLLMSVLDDLKKQYSHYSQLEVTIDIRQLCPFYSDHERLSTILLHVLKNSLDFLDTKKSNNTIDVQVKVSVTKASIEIFDNGIGISDQRIEKVFDMFYKATSQSKGSGLGLYLARETVARLHGTINIYARLGVGTLVRLDIPNASPEHL